MHTLRPQSAPQQSTVHLSLMINTTISTLTATKMNNKMNKWFTQSAISSCHLQSFILAVYCCCFFYQLQYFKVVDIFKNHCCWEIETFLNTTAAVDSRLFVNIIVG